MNFPQILSVTLLVFFWTITFSQGELGESSTSDATIYIRVKCPCVVSIKPSPKCTVSPFQPSKPVIKSTPPEPKSTSPSFQPSLPHSSQPPPIDSNQPPFLDPYQPPPPASNQPPSLDPYQPSPPGSYQPFPSNPKQPPPPGSNWPPSLYPYQPSPPHSFQSSPPCSYKPSQSSSFQPSTSCPPNWNYRQPLATVNRWIVPEANALFFLVHWYFPQSAPNFQTIIKYTIDGNDHFTPCNDKQLENIENHDLKISSLTGQCTLQFSSSNSPGTYAVKFTIDNDVKYTISPIENKNQWMYYRKELLGDLSLFELVIPGTHESAASSTTDIPFDLEESQRNQHGILHQTLSIDVQLQDGIRYLDLRPAHFGKGRTGMNGPQEPAPLNAVVKQIITFIENSQEIVIVSIRDFSEGFKFKTDHKIFINYLKKLFGKHAYIYRSITPKLNDIWRSNRRLILLYHHPMYTFGNFLWPGIAQIEKNFKYPEDEPSNKRKNRRRTLQAIIPQLLHKGLDLYDAIGDLSTATFNWATGVGRSDVNIIAVDYYKETGVVDLAIQLNEERAREKACIKCNMWNIGLFG